MRPSLQRLIQRATLRLDAQRWPRPGPPPSSGNPGFTFNGGRPNDTGPTNAFKPWLFSSLLGVKRHGLAWLGKYPITENDTICIPKRMLKLESYDTCIAQDNRSDSEDVLTQVPTEPVSEIDQTLQGGRIKELDIFILLWKFCHFIYPLVACLAFPYIT
ncbi:uncharacterized protein N7506_002311 [Penicillium brevicompactum]|uniref:uncharacterized protein n=1 Tax=Penicillium brevicompactum TaxID=5074 RepID=UPI0025409C9B|nr:uncharacterized protein N7506_002311 [Penicillium brevicompactum]KAJ5349058.1 hypothetical protein N7506_002311 [Penicillium brevicompactum]